MLDEILTVAALLVIGYGFGCFSTGYFVGKINGTDIRAQGSGNVGTTNALRTMGKKAGLITFLGDFLKALIPTLLVRFLVFSNDPAEWVYIYTLTIGLGVVLGHNFPFYLHFKGGKGIAVSAGVIVAATDWKLVLVGLVIFIAAVAITKYVSVGSLIIVWYLPIYAIYRYHTADMFIYMLILSLIFTILAYIKHRGNIKRLIHGTENKLFGNKEKTN